MGFPEKPQPVNEAIWIEYFDKNTADPNCWVELREFYRTYFVIGYTCGGVDMAKFEFYLGEEDTERLFAIKEDAGKGEFTGNQFAKELLVKELHRLHPATVKFDDDTGERIK